MQLAFHFDRSIRHDVGCHTGVPPLVPSSRLFAADLVHNKSWTSTPQLALHGLIISDPRHLDFDVGRGRSDKRRLA